ncbi:Heterokaryon incompatibility protein 6, OR allele [Lachnellula arida]|uniref:Heterokaryon incompatibility protein 6, OR allele n=1 Tax=Lachnellula arida TaxID=1316785 RepID=A0A8T9B951_9HELO|nr:Heterokaryon incompatibility protein 6, OR allele [Lachnellula arida]
MEEPPAYHYEPITHAKEIRLLEIAPGPDDDPILCSIAHFSFENTAQEQYFALSYEWGSEDEPRRHIFLNGYTVLVRGNLWQALWHLRKRAGCRDVTCESDVITYGASAAWLCRSKIWIDALCVNQFDTAERNHQVRLMAQIYRNAKEVLVWLGPFVNLAESKELNYVYRRSMIAIESYRGRGDLSDLVQLKTRSPLLNALRVLGALLERPYWQRIWIIQEIALASKFALLCGEFWIDPVILDIFRHFSEQDTDALEDYSSYCLEVDLAGPKEYMLINVRGSNQHVPDFSQMEKLAIQWERMQHRHDAENDMKVIMRFPRDVRTIIRSKGFIITRHRQSKQNTLQDLLWSYQGSSCSDPRDKIYGLLGLALDCQNEELEVDYSKSLFEIYKDVVNFYSKSYSSLQSPYMPHVVRFSQLLQRIFGSMYELEEAVAKHPKETNGALELIKARGIILGNVSRLKRFPDPGQEAGSTSTDTGTSSSEFLDLMERVITIDPNVSNAFHASTKEQRETTAQIDTSQTQEHSRFLNFKLESGRAGIISANARKGDVICQFLGCDICAVLRRSADCPRYSVVGRAMVQKSRLESRLEESCSWDELKWRENSHCIPGLNEDFGWPPDKTINLELDIITLLQLTR